MIFVEAILFVLSSGLLFNEQFRENKPLFLLAGLIALTSSYFLFEEMTARLIKRELTTVQRQSPSETMDAAPLAPQQKGAAPPPRGALTQQSPMTKCITFNGRELCP